MAQSFHWGSESYKHALRATRELSNVEGLSPADRSNLTQLLEVELSDMVTDKTMTAADLRRDIGKFSTQLHDLNGDGTPEVIIQASDPPYLCGATGNCSLWIFRKDGNRYRMILNSDGEDGIGAAQSVILRESASHGFRDIVLSAHESAFEQLLVTYRFDGSKYRPANCYEANWDNAEKKKKQEPRIKPCPKT